MDPRPRALSCPPAFAFLERTKRDRGERMASEEAVALDQIIALLKTSKMESQIE